MQLMVAFSRNQHLSYSEKNAVFVCLSVSLSLSLSLCVCVCVCVIPHICRYRDSDVITFLPWPPSPHKQWANIMFIIPTKKAQVSNTWFNISKWSTSSRRENMLTSGRGSWNWSTHLHIRRRASPEFCQEIHSPNRFILTENHKQTQDKKPQIKSHC